jgi:hypothetical protein
MNMTADQRKISLQNPSDSGMDTSFTGLGGGINSSQVGSKLEHQDKIIKEKTKIQNDLKLKKGDYQLFETIIPEGKGKLGKIVKASVRKQECVCKVLKMNKITVFQTEGFQNVLLKTNLLQF